MPIEGEDFGGVVSSMKLAAAALRDAGIPFLLGGGLACWARGGPESEHDVDFFVREEDAEPALEALADAGLKTEKPPEEWLYKAWDGDTLIDLIFRPIGKPLGDEFFERAEELEVAAVRMQVAALEDILVTKLLALNEQYLSYESALEMARSLREQIDWDDVRARTEHSPFAKAFFTLVEELGIVEPATA